MPALWRMVEDHEPEVRRIVAERLPTPLLDCFVNDADLLVRWEAAARALGPVLERLAHDPEAEIRERAQARLQDSVRAEPVEAGAVHSAPFDRLRANGGEFRANGQTPVEHEHG